MKSQVNKKDPEGRTFCRTSGQVLQMRSLKKKDYTELKKSKGT